MTALITALAVLAALAVALPAHYAFWGRIYRLRLDSDALLTAPTDDGWQLAVAHFRPAERVPGRPPVILCHGLSANRLNLMLPGEHSLAAYLKRAGFEVFVPDLRGAGDSRPPPGRHLREVDFDRHVYSDAPAVLAKALEVSGADKAFWVGHSMGGLIGLALAQTPAGARLAGVATLGSPTIWTYHRPWLVRVLRVGLPLALGGVLRQRWLVRLVAPYLYFHHLLGDVVINPRNMDARVNRRVAYHVLSDVSGRLLRQFSGWMANDTWETAEPRRDLRAGMRELHTPVLLMAGSKDVLSPPDNVKAAYEGVGSEDKTLVILGKERGDAQDYGHGDLVFGRKAPEEVFPQIERWLRARSPA